MENLGLVIYFFGIRITRDRKNPRIYLYQDIYITKILETFRITGDINTKINPLDPGALNNLVLY
jgi:hypothetical protein